MNPEPNKSGFDVRFFAIYQKSQWLGEAGCKSTPNSQKKIVRGRSEKKIRKIAENNFNKWELETANALMLFIL